MISTILYEIWSRTGSWRFNLEKVALQVTLLKNVHLKIKWRKTICYVTVAMHHMNMTGSMLRNAGVLCNAGRGKIISGVLLLKRLPCLTSQTCSLREEGEGEKALGFLLQAAEVKERLNTLSNCDICCGRQEEDGFFFCNLKLVFLWSLLQCFFHHGWCFAVSETHWQKGQNVNLS